MGQKLTNFCTLVEAALASLPLCFSTHAFHIVQTMKIERADDRGEPCPRRFGKQTCYRVAGKGRQQQLSRTTAISTHSETKKMLATARAQLFRVAEQAVRPSTRLLATRTSWLGDDCEFLYPFIFSSSRGGRLG